MGKTFMRTLADHLAPLRCVNEIVYYPAERTGIDDQVAAQSRALAEPGGEIPGDLSNVSP